MSDTSPTQDRLAVANFLLKLAGVVVLVLIAWPLRGPLVERLSTGLEEVEAFGVKFKFVASRIEDTFTEASAADPKRWGDPAVTVPSLRARLEALGPAISGARVLWVDEGHPSSNLYERRILQTIGMSVDMVQTPEQAMNLIGRSCYDVVISEMRRADDPAAGKEFASDLDKVANAPELVFYIMDLKRWQGTPAYAHGITNSPAELVHMVLDVVERRLNNRCIVRGG